MKNGDVLAYLRKHGKSQVRDVSNYFKVSWDSAKYHLSVLEKKGLVQKDEDGLYYCIDTTDDSEDFTLGQKYSVEDRILELFADGLPRKPIDVVRVMRIGKNTARSAVNRLYKAGCYGYSRTVQYIFIPEHYRPLYWVQCIICWRNL